MLTLALPQVMAQVDAATISGVVRDRANREPLAAVNIRVLGTSRGTITNAQGRFSLTLPAGTYQLRISMLGYASDTVRTAVPRDDELTSLLQPSAIVLPEVVVTSEDPAVEIIRRAIANKRRWVDRLLNYQMDAFTRQVLRRDTSVASITEAYTRGYWQQGDTLREVVLQKRQTRNIQAGFNFASVGQILNFNDERVRFVGYSFVGPTAQDALDHYVYKLLRTRISYDREMYEIRMTPRSRTTPLFAGTVHIEGGSYALVGIDVEPNEAFQLPFVRDRKIRYRQQFDLHEQTFWLPVDIRVDARVRVSVPGFSIPAIDFSQTSVISGYRVNTVIPDSIFRKPRLTVDSSATRIDSSYWAAHQILPLNPEEASAYTTLDSTQSLDVQFRPGGMMMSLGGEAGTVGSLLHYLDAAYNRVEGFRLGARVDLEKLLPVLAVRGGFSYGFSSKRSVYSAGTTVFTGVERTLGFGGDVYRRTESVPDHGYYGSLINSLAALFAKQDYPDYYLATGWRALVTAHPSRALRIDLSFLDEQHRSLEVRTDFSILFPSREFRVNPPVADGRLRSVKLEGRIGEERVPLDFLFRNGIDVAIEYSSPSFARSDYDFARVDVVGSLSVPTGSAFFLRPGFLIRAGAGAMSGAEPPPQRYFHIESGLAGYGPFGVMRGLDPKTYSGVGYWALNVEHNFRSLPFLALDLPFLYENNIEFVVHGGAARTWSRGGIALPTTPGIYYEAGFGVSRLFELLRADLTWRLTGPAGFRFTLATANLM
jgi:hypothetical protein